jgi:hypothetical protein
MFGMPQPRLPPLALILPAQRYCLHDGATGAAHENWNRCCPFAYCAHAPRDGSLGIETVLQDPPPLETLYCRDEELFASSLMSRATSEFRTETLSTAVIVPCVMACSRVFWWAALLSPRRCWYCLGFSRLRSRHRPLDLLHHAPPPRAPS